MMSTEEEIKTNDTYYNISKLCLLGLLVRVIQPLDLRKMNIFVFSTNLPTSNTCPALGIFNLAIHRCKFGILSDDVHLVAPIQDRSQLHNTIRNARKGLPDGAVDTLERWGMRMTWASGLDALEMCW